MKPILTVLLMITLSACATAETAQPDFVPRAKPKRYRSVAVSPTTTRVVRVEVYADELYVKETMHWETRVAEQLELATTIGETELDVRFEVLKLSRWTPTQTSLEGQMDELARVNISEEADLAVAFTGAMGVPSDNQHQLGASDILGDRMVIRAMNPTLEWEQVQSLGLDENAQRGVFRDRLRRKEAAVFLHAFGHLNGAVHTRAEGWLMSTLYDQRDEHFCPINSDIVREVLRLRSEHKDRGELVRAAATKIRELTEGDSNHGLESGELASLIALEGRSELMGNSTYESVRNAQMLANQSQFQEALVALAPALDSAPDNPTVVQIHCFLMSRMDGSLKESLEICTHAADLNSDDYMTALSAGQVLQKMERWNESLRWIQIAEKRLSAASKPHVSQWTSISNAYINAFAFDFAEQALAHVPVPVRAGEIDQRLERMRQLTCMPPGKLKGLEERSAVAEGQELMALTLRRKSKRADIESFRAKYPEAPMGPASQCVRDLHRRGVRANQSLCEQVLKDYPDCWPVRMSLGRFHLKRQEWNLALPHLQRAFEIQPDPDIERDLNKARQHAR